MRSFYKNLLGVLAVAAILLPGSAFQVVEAQTDSLQLDASKNLRTGSLVKVQARNGAAVYQISSDGKKYVFPDQKTYETWYDDFSDVQEVSQDTLDNYQDGGLVTFRPGTRLITHRNTAKVYAVGANGQAIHIPDEATAKKFYGNSWTSYVVDLDPGVFSLAYRAADQELSEDNLPEESLIREKNSGEYYVIENGLRRRVTTKAFERNRFLKKNIIVVDDLSNEYSEGEEVDEEEEGMTIFEPGIRAEKILICHKPLVANANEGRTIRVSERSLAAHLAHGDTRGACEVEDDEDTDEPSTLSVCDHNGDGIRNLTDVAILPQCGTTYDVNGDGIHILTDISLYSSNNQDDSWCSANFVCQPEDESNETETDEDDSDSEDVATLPVCDHNSDGVRNLTDISMFAQCSTTFDANGDGVHNLSDLSLYGQNNQDDEWCSANFVCNPETQENASSEVEQEIQSLMVCDHNDDGIRNLTDVAMFAQCSASFDANDDGIHNLSDIALYSSNNQDDEWCASNFVCQP